MKPGSRKTRSKQGSRPSRDSGKTRPARRYGIAIGLLLAAAAAASFFFNAFAPAPARPREWSFDGPAFAPDATSDDFKSLSLRTVERLLEEVPGRAASHHAVARLHKSLGKSRLANEHWERSVALEPAFAKGYEGMAVVADEGSDFERAVRMFRKAIELSPDDYLLPPLLADSLFKSGQFAEAIDVLRDHVSRQQTTAKALLTLGHSELRLKHYPEAKAAFEAMINNFGDGKEKSALSTAYFGLSKVSMQQGDRQQALAYLEKQQAYVPVDQEIIEDNLKQDDRLWLRGVLVETLWGAGQVYQKYGHLERAEELWQQTAFLDDDDQGCRLALSAQYVNQGRLADALRSAEQLRDIDPTIAEYWWNVGLLNSRLGDLEKAREAIAQARLLDPDNVDYQRASEILDE